MRLDANGIVLLVYGSFFSWASKRSRHIGRIRILSRFHSEQDLQWYTDFLLVSHQSKYQRGPHLSL